MRPPRLRQFAALALIAFSIPASGQSPPSSQTPAGRLEQIDQTYTSNLRRYHAPIIQEYLVSLERLKQTMTQRGGDGTAAVQAEIDRVNRVSAGSGLLSYDALKPAKAENWNEPAPAQVPAPAGLARKAVPANAIILAAAGAKRSSPEAATLAEKPDGRAVPIGSAEWQIDRVPAGEYRISILYSCAGKPAGSVITARLGQASAQQDLDDSNATGGVNEFRITRLGVLRLDTDSVGEALVLRNSDPDRAAIWVRQVIIAKVTENEKN